MKFQKDHRKGVTTVAIEPIMSIALVRTSSLSSGVAWVAYGVLSDSTTSLLASSVSLSSGLASASLPSSFSSSSFSTSDFTSSFLGIALKARDATKYQLWILNTRASYCEREHSKCIESRCRGA